MCALALGGKAQAASYVWSEHQLAFVVPDEGRVVYSTNDHMEIVWDDMAVTIQLFNKYGAEKDAVADELRRRAAGFNMFDINGGKLKVKGFEVCSLNGTLPDGSHALLANLVSKKKNLFVSVTINYLLGNIEEAEDIVKSFTTSTPKKKVKKQKIQTAEDAIKQEKREKEHRQEQVKHYETFEI